MKTRIGVLGSFLVLALIVVTAIATFTDWFDRAVHVEPPVQVQAPVKERTKHEQLEDFVVYLRSSHQLLEDHSNSLRVPKSLAAEDLAAQQKWFSNRYPGLPPFPKVTLDRSKQTVPERAELRKIYAQVMDQLARERKEFEAWGESVSPGYDENQRAKLRSLLTQVEGFIIVIKGHQAFIVDVLDSKLD